MYENQIQNILKENPQIQEILGKVLHKRLINELKTNLYDFSEQECINYIHNITSFSKLAGYIRQNSAIYDNLAKLFPTLNLEEIEPEYEHSLDIDYTARVGNNSIGFQIKPITAKYSFANYSPTERMKAGFKEFKEKFGGNVFIIFSLDGEIGNEDIITEIQSEIERLSK
ncbi:MAG: MjaI family restriction endonuclease [Bacteroidetes bacterium]|nr:MjaI family restriction endonuclease [Bacteroidota bacterium]